jgi:hypothetical protein
MSRVTIRRDDDGNVTVLGYPPKDSNFYFFALGKVLAGIYSEISWVPIEGIPAEFKTLLTRANNL